MYSHQTSSSNNVCVENSSNPCFISTSTFIFKKIDTHDHHDRTISYTYTQEQHHSVVQFETEVNRIV